MSLTFPTYPKINGCFKRHPDTNRFIMDQWSMPEYGLLADCDWQWFEKVDGTNIRVHVTSDIVEYRGRTDGAQIPPRLRTKLEQLFMSDEARERFDETLNLGGWSDFILYGEGYGGKIQKGGNYRPDESFILFDVMVISTKGFAVWLSKFDAREIADSLGYDMVPVCGITSLSKAIEIVSDGFESQLGTPEPEGVVGTPAIDLYDKHHNRIITKIKGVDFR